MENRVRLTIEDGVACVRLNRPDKLNALDTAMFEALIETGTGLHARKDIRTVVLAGEGAEPSAQPSTWTGFSPPQPAIRCCHPSI